MKKLSILILTHNRPLLFKRCINSVLRNLPNYEIEILVNNDTNDIKEIYSDKVSIKYFYKIYNDISKIYSFLFKKSKGEFIYYLEDDDYIKNNFFKEIDFNFDINFFNYCSNSILKNYNSKYFINRFLLKNKKFKNVNNLDNFISIYDNRDFQLSQIIFKKNKLKKIPKGNNIDNDYKLFKSLSPASIKYNNKTLYVQTTDGNDNISFKEYNKDERFC